MDVRVGIDPDSYRVFRKGIVEKLRPFAQKVDDIDFTGGAAARLTKALGGIMPDTDPDIDPITPARFCGGRVWGRGRPVHGQVLPWWRTQTPQTIR